MARYDELLERFSDAAEPGLLDVFLDGLVEAVAGCDATVRHYDREGASSARAIVADAMRVKGRWLSAAGHKDEALAVLDELLARFGDSSEPRLRLPLGLALFGPGTTLYDICRTSDLACSLNACDLASHGEMRVPNRSSEVSWFRLSSRPRQVADSHTRDASRGLEPAAPMRTLRSDAVGGPRQVWWRARVA